MIAVPPYPNVPGDNESEVTRHTIINVAYTVRARIMARTGVCRGMNAERAVWCFGFVKHSESAKAFGVSIEEPTCAYHVDNGRQSDSLDDPCACADGFLWILATRKTGKIVSTFRGYALDLPAAYRAVIDAEVTGFR